MIAKRELLDSGMWQGLDPAERLIYLALWLRANELQECYPSVAKLVADTGFGRTRIIEGVKKMALLGVIKKGEKRPQHSTLYKVRNIEKIYEEGK